MTRSSPLPALLVLTTLPLLGTDCPGRVPLPPPPRGQRLPLLESLRSRDHRLDPVQANATLRLRLPPGAPGAPGGKVHALVMAAARPDRARVDLLTPLGSLGATLVIAGGRLSFYQPLDNSLLTGPLSSPELAERSPLPLPLASLPDLLRGAAPLAPGEPSEVTPLVSSTGGEPRRVLEVRDSGRLVQRVLFDEEGGYPVEDQRFDAAGLPWFTVRYLEYGSAETDSGPIAFPQRLKAVLLGPHGESSVEVILSGIVVGRALPDDSFVLAPSPPPRVEEFQ